MHHLKLTEHSNISITYSAIRAKNDPYGPERPKLPEIAQIFFYTGWSKVAHDDTLNISAKKLRRKVSFGRPGYIDISIATMDG